MTSHERSSLNQVLDAGAAMSQWMYDLAQSPVTPPEERATMLR